MQKDAGETVKALECSKPDYIFDNFENLNLTKFDVNDVQYGFENYVVTKANVTLNLLPVFNKSSKAIKTSKAITISTGLDSRSNNSFNVDYDESLSENKQNVSIPKSMVNTLKKHFASP